MKVFSFWAAIVISLIGNILDAQNTNFVENFDNNNSNWVPENGLKYKLSKGLCFMESFHQDSKALSKIIPFRFRDDFEIEFSYLLIKDNVYAAGQENYIAFGLNGIDGFYFQFNNNGYNFYRYDNGNFTNYFKKTTDLFYK